MREKLPVKIKLGDKEYDLDYQEELRASEETINEDLIQQPGLFAWYAVLHELAEEEYARSKMALEMAEAELDAHYRKDAADKKEKIMEKQVLSKVMLDDKYILLRDTMITARKNVGTLKAIKEAFAHRKETVIALASNMRAQADPDIFLKKQKIKEEVTK